MAVTRRILTAQDGPTVLVGHSYGGAVITEAGTHPKVAALVYITASQVPWGLAALSGTISARRGRASQAGI